MATYIKPIKSPFAPLRDVAQHFLKQTLMDLEVNAQLQRIYPSEVYKGYKEVNEYRRKHGMWYATGEGAKSFEGHIYQANEERGLLTVGIRYNNYLRYVDIGVGLTGPAFDPASHIKADDVERSRRATFGSRYIRGKWNRREGKSHRPAIMRTIRRLQKRYRNYLADFYGYQGAVYIIHAFEGMGKAAQS